MNFHSSKLLLFTAYAVLHIFPFVESPAAEEGLPRFYFNQAKEAFEDGKLQKAVSNIEFATEFVEKSTSESEDRVFLEQLFGLAFHIFSAADKFDKSLFFARKHAAFSTTLATKNTLVRLERCEQEATLVRARLSGVAGFYESFFTDSAVRATAGKLAVELLRLLEDTVLQECGRFVEFKYLRVYLGLAANSLAANHAARATLSQLLRKDQENPDFVFLRGVELLLAGDLVRAKHAFVFVKMNAPDSLLFLPLLEATEKLLVASKKARVLHTQTRFSEEAALLADAEPLARALVVVHADFLYRHALACQSAQAFEEALVSVNNLLRLQKNKDYVALKVDLLVALKRFADAKAVCEKATLMFKRKNKEAAAFFHEKLAEVKQREEEGDDHYAVLGVHKAASAKEIKSKYRELTKKYHPDKAPEDRKAEYSETMAKINEAYDVLIDDQKRREYDQNQQMKRRGGGGNSSFFDFFREDFLDNSGFFGRNNNAGRGQHSNRTVYTFTF